MALTNTYRNKVINGITGHDNTALGVSEVYLGLSFTKPNADGSNIVEPPAQKLVSGVWTDTGYSRTLIGKYNETATQLFYKAGTQKDQSGQTINGETENSKHIYFTEALLSWTRENWDNGDQKTGTDADNELKYFVFFSSATSQELSKVIAYAQLTENGVPKPINVKNANTVVLFRPGQLKIKYVDETLEANINE